MSGYEGWGIRARVEHGLFLFCSCAFSKFFLERGREAEGTRGRSREVEGNDGASLLLRYLLLTGSYMPNSLRLDRQHCLYLLLILHNAGYIA